MDQTALRLIGLDNKNTSPWQNTVPVGCHTAIRCFLLVSLVIRELIALIHPVCFPSRAFGPLPAVAGSWHSHRQQDGRPA